MNILITGGAGYVGSHLTEYLLKKKQLKFTQSIIFQIVQYKL